MSASEKTQRYVAEKLVQLAEKKRLSKISVTELCKECDINRSTFYYHFKDIQDVIHWLYHTEATIPVREKIKGNADPADTSFVTRDILNSLYSHRSFYTQAIKIEGQNSLAEYILTEARENWSLLIDTRLKYAGKQGQDLQGEKQSLLESAVEYYCYGHYAITVDWIKNGMEIKPGKMAELMDTVALQGFDKVMEKYI